MVPKKVRKFAESSLKTRSLRWFRNPKPGFKNTAYFVENDGQRYTLKSSTVADGGTEKRTEYSILRLLKSDSIPKPVAYDIQKNMLMKTYLEGRGKARFTAKDLQEAGKELAKLHRMRFRKPGKPGMKRTPSNYKQYFNQQISILQSRISELTQDERTRRLGNYLSTALTQAVKEERNRTARFSGNDFVVINFDLIPKNILWKGGKPLVIDWGDASIGDPALEISRIFFTLDFTKSQEQALLNAYNSKDPNFLHRIQTYERFLAINRIVFDSTMYHSLTSGRIKSVNNVNPRTFEKRFIEHYADYARKYLPGGTTAQAARDILRSSL